MGNELERESTGRDSGSDRNEINRQLTPYRPPATVSVERVAVHASARMRGNQIVTVLREEHTLIVSSREERPRLRRAIGCESTCSYDKYGKESVEQEWYQCHTCWGGDSCYGCCEYCAKTCHEGHNLVYLGSVGGFCDCGINCHKAAVCTCHSTGKQLVKQPFYRCYSCFSEENHGCCYQCMKHCHAGHQVVFKRISPGAFCDCGLSGCKIACKIGSP